ncbi:hypothetical protein SAY87_006063 [Trapa incisa]|uniref:Tyrosinase copper-binding domain-containing protein n=1 Tax=Trapa incisa TaxID=236973 RepID=A0AAN7KDK7_9MYRT|nr:hypothetical protein SAY87_006063 [Trapa incisa]
MSCLSPFTAAIGDGDFFLRNKTNAYKTYSSRRAIKVNYPRVVLCKAPVSGEEKEPSLGKYDRRDVLVGLGGLYGAASLGNEPFALGAPVAAPDLSKCGPADLPKGATPTNCCPPVSTKIVDFKLPPPRPLRYRPAAHLVDKDYIAKYAKAVELMKALPDDDPRSFKQQADIHCAYCDGAYDQIGFPDLEIQVHNSWLFFPFHRYYLYFNERILGKLIGDPDFALPFWNWDAPAGMLLPELYANSRSSLYDKLRNVNHQPPTLVDLDYSGTDPTMSKEEQLSRNLTIMYRQMVSSAKTPQLFFGSAYRAGDNPEPGSGTIEHTPHGNLHFWCGDNTQPNSENMGNFYSAGRDPIFFCHHSNVDRMWALWKTLPGKKRVDIKEPDYLNASFLFYDENAQLVRVKVRDCLDQRKLGYDYQKVDIPWLKAKPTPRKKGKNVARRPGVALAAEAPKDAPSVQFPLVLDKVVTTLVSRPKKKRSKEEKEEEEEVLIIEGIEFDKNEFIKFDVYVNDEHDDLSSPKTTEFSGSFVNVPRKHKSGKKTNTCIKLGITELLEDLDNEDDDSILVTLVPKAGVGKVTLGGIKIDFVD